MSEIIFYDPLDGIGDVPIDLHLCKRRIKLRNPFKDEYADDLLVYYQFEGGLWIEHWGAHLHFWSAQSEVTSAPDESWMEGYREVHPVSVVRELHGMQIKIPSELDEYRGFIDEKAYSKWLWEQSEEGKGFVEKTKPRWNSGLRALMLNDGRQIELPRFAPNQFRILDEFERQGWPDYINNPFSLQEQLKQTIKDFNGRPDVPLQLEQDGLRVRWRLLPE